jgi:hypothetical protein
MGYTLVQGSRTGCVRARHYACSSATTTIRTYSGSSIRGGSIKKKTPHEMIVIISPTHAQFTSLLYTLENSYIQYFHYHNRLIQEQTITKPNPLFQLVYNQESKNLDPDPPTDTHTNT